MATGGISGAAIRAGGAYIVLTVKDQVSQGLNKIGTKIKNFGASIQRIGLDFTMAGAAMGYPLVRAVQVAATFSDKMLAIKAVTGATTDQMRELEAQVRQVADRTGRTITELASAGEELARGGMGQGPGGFDVGQMAKAMELSALFARAAKVDADRASEVLQNVAAAFETKDYQQVADVLTFIANKSTVSVEELFEAMTYGAQTSHALGLSLQETGAAMGILADRAIKGSLAGTTLRKFMTDLTTKTAEFQKLFGFDPTEMLNAGDFGSVLAGMNKQMAKMTRVERIQIFEEAFGRGKDAAAILAGLVDLWEDYTTGGKNAVGITQQIAKVMDSGPGGSIRRIYAAWESFVESVGAAASTAFGPWETTITGILNGLTALIQQNPELIAGFVRFAAATFAIGAAFLVVAGSIRLFSGYMKFIGFTWKNITKLALVFYKVASGAFSVLGRVLIAALANPLGVIFAIVTGLYLSWANLNGTLGDSLLELKAMVVDMTESLMTGYYGVVDAIMAGNLQLAWQIAIETMKVLWSTFVTYIANIWDGFVASIPQFFQDMSQGILHVIEWFAQKLVDSVNWMLDKLDWAMKQVGLAGFQARLAFDKEFASAIDEAFADKTRERNAALEERRRLRMEELDLRKQELERLADEARKLRAERFKPPPEPDWMAEERRRNFGQGGPKGGGRIGDISAGTFSGFAARLLPLVPAGKKTEEKILDETKKVADSTKETAKNTALMIGRTILSFL